MNLETITLVAIIFFKAIGWVLLLVFMTVFIIKVIYNTIKAERKKKLFTSEMKSGDKVYFPVDSGSINGEILDVNGDDVKIVVTVSKSRVYPND
jgi:preprotein translocase subunit YajC